MSCEELRHLLGVFWREEDRDLALNLIATHVRSCPICSRGLQYRAKELLADTLSCEQCRNLFPTYYEATHPEFPLATMPVEEMAAVAIHLGNCAACKEQYEVLVQLAQLEEGDKE
ncbi:MAG TPA: hypothetical protein VFA41_16375 [Ktedonobacteraceae bacterium]|jgi:predicted anti-sigma-YlaC factor YlaD|nr:hypothetical protein [Ktedonobacteraceae bacterium]